jgi:hypothetical protein
MSATDTIRQIAENSPSVTDFKGSTIVDEKQHLALAAAVANNTHLRTVNLERTDVTTAAAVIWGESLKTNNSITHLDLGYNKIGPPGIIAIGEGLAVNTKMDIIKLHRQNVDYGQAAEDVLAKLYETNTTLQRCYATLHSRSASQANTRGETRNKVIAGRKKEGKDWMDLDPARRDEYAALKRAERKAAEEKAAAANAPITAPVENTGGPYTYKQLTCDAKFRPTDVDTGKKETFLADEEFATVFGMAKDAFEKLPKWKQGQLKKAKNLH